MLLLGYDLCVNIDAMNTPNTPDSLVPPSIRFAYGRSGRVVAEIIPLVSPVVRAFMDGKITAEEYFVLGEAEDAANQRLRDSAYSSRSPDSMPGAQQYPDTAADSAMS